MQNVGAGSSPGPFIDPARGPLDPAACVCLRDPVTGMPITRSGLPASTALPGGPYGPTDLIPLKTSDSWSKVTPMAVATYHLTDSATAYLKYSTGFKSGGINGVAETNADFIGGFGQETMKSWELGWKSRLLDNRLQLNAAAFYNKYDDIQVNTLDRKSTRLNSSHVAISYAVFCLKKKKRQRVRHNTHKRYSNEPHKTN